MNLLGGKQIGIGVCLLVFLLTLFLPVFTVQAQPAFSPRFAPDSGRISIIETPQQFAPSFQPGPSGRFTAPPVFSPGAAPPSGQPGNPNTPPGGTPGGTPSGAPATDQVPPDINHIAQFFSSNNNNTFYAVMIGAGGYVAGLGGLMFDYAFRQTVTEFGCWLTTQCGDGSASGQIGGIVDGLWRVIRDLFNIVFIFSLVWIGLRLILFSDDNSTKKAIGSLIGAALLVNFSLYIAKLIIDISNYTALQIHTAMTSQVTGQFGNNFFALNDTGSISGSFMEVLDINTWFSSTPGGEGIGTSIILGLMTFIFLCYLGFIFLYGAFMLMARFIALIILLIFSPVMFLGWVLPQFKTFSSRWTAMFLGYSFYIPAYVFLLYMSLFILIQFSGTQSGGGYAESLSSGERFTEDTVTLFYVFFLAMGLLYASTKVASAMSKAGAGAAMSIASTGATKLSGLSSASNIALGGMGGGALNLAAGGTERVFGSTEISRGLRTGSDKLRGLKYNGASSYTDSTKAREEGARFVATEERKRSLAKALKKGTPDEKKKAFEKLSASDIDEMAKTSDGKKTLRENAHLLTDAHIKKLESDHPALAVEVKAKAKTKQAELFRADPATFFAGKKPADVAKLDATILTNIDATPFLTQKMLYKIFNDGNLTDAERGAIKSNLNVTATVQANGITTYTAGTAPGTMNAATYALIVRWLNTIDGQLF